ncbi:tetratricopeptide repeat protein [Salinivibrio socompensis]|uniref:tetratricopeptide repeat protein n=1 Tax=Salinivibrio socompensis TaxID=1510206 RepID=UPI0004AEA744|nr:hypothetical protein [Salinivibrio socompensis]
MTQENDGQTNMTLDDAFQLGIRLYQEGNKSDARQVFEQILNHAPDTVPVRQVLAVLDAEEGQYHQAMTHIEHALGLAPEDHSLWFDKAQMLTQQGITKPHWKLSSHYLPRPPPIKTFLIYVSS